MFDTLRDYILTHFPEVKECYEPLAASAASPTPYCVISYGPEVVDVDIFGGQTMYVAVYHTTYSNVVDLSKRISRSIASHTSIDYEGVSGQPYYDTSLNLHQQILVFNCPTLIKEV